MATQGRRKDIALDQSLWQEPWRFEFFQAVRVLELINQERKPVGHDFPAADEVVHFRSLLSRSFPAASIARIDPGQADGETKIIPEMQVAFMGLAGPSGVLPESYLDQLLQRLREHDHALRDFLDLFNHRTISLFYRAWEKYRFPVSFERARRTAENSDLFSWCLECLVGIGTAEQKSRLPFANDILLQYAGHFAHFARPAAVLEGLLVDYLQIPVKIEQLIVRWLPLEVDERTQLPSTDCPGGRFNQLGTDLVIGNQVLDVQSSFRLRLGPLPRRLFAQFLPGGARLRQLISLTRIYTGPELDFEVQLVLEAAEVPECRLASRQGTGTQLGWNSWLQSRPSAVDRDDTRFWSAKQLAVRS